MTQRYLYQFPWKEGLDHGEKLRYPSGIEWGPGVGIIDPHGDVSGWGICSSPHRQNNGSWVLIAEDVHEEFKTAASINRRDRIANRWGVNLKSNKLSHAIAELIKDHRPNGKHLYPSKSRSQYEIVLAGQVIWSEPAPPIRNTVSLSETFPTTGNPATLTQGMTWVRTSAGGVFLVTSGSPNRLSNNHATEYLLLLSSGTGANRGAVDTNNNQVSVNGVNGDTSGNAGVLSVGCRGTDGGTRATYYRMLWRSQGGSEVQRACYTIADSTTTLNDDNTPATSLAVIGVKCDGSTITWDRPSAVNYQTTDTNITAGVGAVIEMPNLASTTGVYVQGDLTFIDIVTGVAVPVTGNLRRQYWS